MAVTRINGRDMVLILDGVDRSDETSAIAFNYGTRQTFADMRGKIPKRLDMTLNQDLLATSLYRIATSGDTTPLVGTVKPLGNSAASVEQPHYSFNVTPGGISGDTYLGGEAAEDASETLQVEVQWLIDSWTEVTA
ncbi:MULTISPECIES: hypothetical protein [unclassified Isoptericola]|uniref:hypothetical protein n=1 Tax=unclassified Isoptericola TaxID=2623355 RepID=UPI00364811B6